MAEANDMANIVRRFDPFREMEDMMRGLVFKPMRMAEYDAPEIVKIDVAEDDKAYRVSAEMAGVKREDIKVSIDGNQVSISAEVKQEKEEKKGEQVIHSERYYGSVARSFTLAQPVDEASAEAKYENGVLKLTLPKKAGGSTKRLTIS
jgi:HSP20 family protein